MQWSHNEFLILNLVPVCVVQDESFHHNLNKTSITISIPIRRTLTTKWNKEKTFINAQTKNASYTGCELRFSVHLNRSLLLYGRSIAQNLLFYSETPYFMPSLQSYVFMNISKIISYHRMGLKWNSTSQAHSFMLSYSHAAQCSIFIALIYTPFN